MSSREEKRQFVAEVVKASHSMSGTHGSANVAGDTNQFWQSENIPNGATALLHVTFSEPGVGLGIAIQAPHAGWYGLAYAQDKSSCWLSRILAEDALGENDGFVEVWKGRFAEKGCGQRLVRIDFDRKDIFTNTLRLEFVARVTAGDPHWRASVNRLQLISKDPVPPVPEALQLAEYLLSESCRGPRKFIIDNIGQLHDTELIISYGDGQQTTFRCFHSLLTSAMFDDDILVERRSMTDKFRHRVILGDNVTELVVTEKMFLGVLLGSVPVADLMNTPLAMLDFCEIIGRLRMKRLLWNVCEVVHEGEADLRLTFELLKCALDRFGVEEIEDEDIFDLTFRFPVVIANAAFEGLQKNKEEILAPRASSREIASMKRWLMQKSLSEPLRSQTPISAREHPELQGIPRGFECLSPIQLLSAQFSILANVCSHPNVILRSALGRGSVETVLEPMILSFRFFGPLLRFGGQDTEKFDRSRVIVLRRLSVPAIRLLSQFALTGKFSSATPPIVHCLLCLLKAEEDLDERFSRYCIDTMKAIDTKKAEFVTELAEVGNSFDDCQAKNEILESWASQGKYTKEVLLKKIAKASRAAESLSELEQLRQELQAERRERIAEVAEVKRQMGVEIAELKRRLSALEEDN